MRWLSPGIAVLIVAVLALLLVGYVFGVSERRSDDPAISRDQAAASCSSRQTSELLKRELFSRATALRGRDQAAMAQAARYSVVRIASAVATKVDAGSGTVTCTSRLTLDLPPEMAVVGGRRSLSSPAEYQASADEREQGKFRLLSDPTGIVTPLAALTVVPSDAPEVLDLPSGVTTTGVDGAEPAEPAPLPPVPTTLVPPQRPQSNQTVAAPPARGEAAPRQVARQAPRQPEPKAVPAAPRRPAVAAKTDAPEPRPAPPVARATPAPEPRRQVAGVRPSFDCRRARARAEIAVCGDGSLAALDQRMSAQFFSALGAARPGQRALLQRSRNRFLAFRNRCSSNACIAQAYRERMAEIDAIMTGGF